MPDPTQTTYAPDPTQRQTNPWGYGLDAMAQVAASTANPKTDLGMGLMKVALGHMAMRKMKMQQGFIQSVESVMGGNLSMDDVTGSDGQPVLGKKGQLYKLILGNPQIARETLGEDTIKAIQENYLKGNPEAKEWKPRTMEEAIQFEQAKKGVGVLDSADGLSAQDQIAARSLARKIAGVRGADKALPAIYAELKQGKTIDQIEDELRYAGQSPEFVGPVREAAQTILLTAGKDKTQGALDFLDDMLSSGNTEGVKSQLKRLAITEAGTEEGRAIRGKERTAEFLAEIQSDLDALERSGIQTGIFTGTSEQIASKIGRVVNPETRKVATKIATAIQNYRRSMSGVAFSVPESREYVAMFPSIGRVANFNRANIEALRETMQGDLRRFYSLQMGEEQYRAIFGETAPQAPRQPQAASSDDIPREDALAELRRRGKIR